MECAPEKQTSRKVSMNRRGVTSRPNRAPASQMLTTAATALSTDSSRPILQGSSRHSGPASLGQKEQPLCTVLAGRGSRHVLIGVLGCQQESPSVPIKSSRLRALELGRIVTVAFLLAEGRCLPHHRCQSQYNIDF